MEDDETSIELNLHFLFPNRSKFIPCQKHQCLYISGNQYGALKTAVVDGKEETGTSETIQMDEKCSSLRDLNKSNGRSDCADIGCFDI